MNLEERTVITSRPYHAGGIEARGWLPDGDDLGDGYTLHAGIYRPKRPDHEARTQTRRGPCLVIVHAGRMVGFARFSAMYVLPSHRGRGLATKLYAGLLERWPERAAEHYAKGIAVTEGGEATVRRAWAELEASGNAPPICR